MDNVQSIWCQATDAERQEALKRWAERQRAEAAVPERVRWGDECEETVLDFVEDAAWWLAILGTIGAGAYVAWCGIVTAAAAALM